VSPQSLDTEQVRSAFQFISSRMKEKSEALRKLDAACGDGDLGITVTNGFTAVENQLQKLAGESPSRLLRTLGMTFNNAAASTFGVFFATAFMHAGKAIDGLSAIEASHVPAMMRSAAEGIMARGRADVGDRTLLDALVPACDAADTALADGGDLQAILSAAAAAAVRGAEATRNLSPRVGRARWLGDKIKGVEDPGAVLVAYFLEACRDAWQDEQEETA